MTVAPVRVAGPYERPPCPGPSATADAVLAAARENGFDLRRALFVGYVVEVRDGRSAAQALWRRAVGDGWQASMYAADGRWLVRLGHNRRVRTPALCTDALYVTATAGAYGGTVTGFAVEDLAAGDRWDAVAARARRVAAATAAARARTSPACRRPGDRTRLPRTA